MADTLDPNDSLRRQNPLGKLPTLILEDGTALFDSPVILEYLDHLAGGGRILPVRPRRAVRVLRLQALADGIMDAALLQVLEVRFHEDGARSRPFLDHQAGKVARALAELEAAPPAAQRRRHCRHHRAGLRRWAISTCASPGHGATPTPGWWPGSTPSPARCPRSRRRGRCEAASV